MVVSSNTSMLRLWAPSSSETPCEACQCYLWFDFSDPESASELCGQGAALEDESTFQAFPGLW